MQLKWHYTVRILSVCSVADFERTLRSMIAQNKKRQLFFSEASLVDATCLDGQVKLRALQLTYFTVYSLILFHLLAGSGDVKRLRTSIDGP